MLLGRALLDVDIHGIAVPSRSLALFPGHKVLSVQAAANILPQGLNDAHVVHPAVVLLLPLPRLTGIRLRRRGANRDSRVARLWRGSAARRLLGGADGRDCAGLLEHAARVATALAGVEAGAQGGGGGLSEALVNGGQAGGQTWVHDGRGRAVVARLRGESR